MLDFVY